MSAAEVASCPSWCEGDCRDEHRLTNDYVPASGGLPRPSRYGGGYWFPGVGVGLSWDTVDHLQPTVVLHIGGEGADEQADLHLHEAKRLLQVLARAVETLEAST